MLSKRMFLHGQKLYNGRGWHGSYHFPVLVPSHPVGLGQMAWAIDLVLYNFISLHYLLRLCSFHFLGHSMGHSSIVIYTLHAALHYWGRHGMGHLSCTLQYHRSYPIHLSAPAAFNYTKCITCLHTHILYKILATFIPHMILNRFLLR
jgi:hypothetical protein